MAVDFHDIPECVFELFCDIMWADRENRNRKDTCSDPFSAEVIAWGWNPPLMKLGEHFLTAHGMAAYAWWRLKRNKKRIGRPRKQEASGDTLIESALVKHHGYQEGGSVSIYEPASLERLKTLSTMSKATVSRYLAAKFGDDAYCKYKAACAREDIGHLLAKWQGELNKDFIVRAIQLEAERRKQQDD